MEQRTFQTQDLIDLAEHVLHQLANLILDQRPDWDDVTIKLTVTHN